MNEQLTARKWLYSKLASNAVGVSNRVYDTIAPRGATEPYVVFLNQSTRDVRGVGTANIMTNSLWVVKVVAETKTFDSLDTIADAIYTALNGSGGVVTGGGTVVGCVREQPFEMTEDQDGAEYRHLGGIYRIWAQ